MSPLHAPIPRLMYTFAKICEKYVNLIDNWRSSLSLGENDIILKLERGL